MKRTSLLCVALVVIGLAAPRVRASTSTSVVEPPVPLNVKVVNTPPADTNIGEWLEFEVVVSAETRTPAVILVIRPDVDREHVVMETQGTLRQEIWVGDDSTSNRSRYSTWVPEIVPGAPVHVRMGFRTANRGRLRVVFSYKYSPRRGVVAGSGQTIFEGSVDDRANSDHASASGAAVTPGVNVDGK